MSTKFLSKRRRNEDAYTYLQRELRSQCPSDVDQAIRLIDRAAGEQRSHEWRFNAALIKARVLLEAGRAGDAANLLSPFWQTPDLSSDDACVLATLEADCMAAGTIDSKIGEVLRRGISKQTRDIDCWPLVVRFSKLNELEPSDVVVMRRCLDAILNWFKVQPPATTDLPSQIQSVNELIRHAQEAFLEFSERLRTQPTKAAQEAFLADYLAQEPIGYYRDAAAELVASS